ncbi:hypothetical protein [Geodermatophilus sp. SYSU D00766]
MSLAAGSAQGVAQWILIVLGIILGIAIALLLCIYALGMLIRNIQDMGIGRFFFIVIACMVGSVALSTLIGTAMTGRVATSAAVGAGIGAMLSAMIVFDDSGDFW